MMKERILEFWEYDDEEAKQKIKFKKIDLFRAEYELQVINADGICIWKHGAKDLSAMADDKKHLEGFADKGHMLEIIEPGEEKKQVKLTTELLETKLF